MKIIYRMYTILAADNLYKSESLSTLLESPIKFYPIVSKPEREGAPTLMFVKKGLLDYTRTHQSSWTEFIQKKL